MEKLPLSIGILSWKSEQTLIETLTSYHENGLLKIANDVKILFQECSSKDLEITKHFGIDYISINTNTGIGNAFISLTGVAETDNVMILEHDWKLVEDIDTTYKRLSEGIELLNNGYDVIRYRHRTNYGYPHFSFQYKGRELDYYDNEIECTSPHLLDSLHWCDPSVEFPDKIQKEGDYFVTTSRWANFTNNPCMYKKQFYLDKVKTFVGEGIQLEGKISKWWAKQNFRTAQGEGLFQHKDIVKYGR